MPAGIAHLANGVGCPFRQGFDIVVIFHHAEPVSGGAHVFMLALHGGAIDVKDALLHLNVITGQACPVMTFR